MDFSLCDFPVPYTNAENTKNWFDFNDSTVDPIMPGTLQKMFGGSNANAYMLVYRQRAVAKQISQQPQIPAYWIPEIEKLNREDAISRDQYDILKN